MAERETSTGRRKVARMAEVDILGTKIWWSLDRRYKRMATGMLLTTPQIPEYIILGIEQSEGQDGFKRLAVPWRLAYIGRHVEIKSLQTTVRFSPSGLKGSGVEMTSDCLNCPYAANKLQRNYVVKIENETVTID